MLPDSTLAELDEQRRQNAIIQGSAVDTQEPIWPELDRSAAYHGVIGDLVKIIEPETESDPAAILFQILALAGCCLGRHAYYPVEGDKHYPNLYAVLVGQSGKGRKGTSFGQARRAFKIASPLFVDNCIQSGLSSGEGLIHAVRDEIDDDPGVFDKRLLVAESEFAGLLRVMQREGNIVSRIIRDAWDRGNLGVMTKKCPTRATGAHIGIVGHITADELRRYLDRTEAANGFANRFMYVAVKRSKCLPFGGDLKTDDFREPASRMAVAFDNARNLGAVEFDPAARETWKQVYPALSEGMPGLHGSVTGRAEAQVVRMALIYALMDCKNTIGVRHLEAALAAWDYTDESARYVFSDASGDPTRDILVKAVKASEFGLTRTEISRLFAGHTKSAQIDRTLSDLMVSGQVEEKSIKTDGRPKEVWRWI